MRLDDESRDVMQSDGRCMLCGEPASAEWHPWKDETHVIAFCTRCATGYEPTVGVAYSELGALIGDALIQRMNQIRPDGWDMPGRLDAEIRATLARLEVGMRHALGAYRYYHRQRQTQDDTGRGRREVV